MPPYMVISRSLPEKPSVARIVCSQFCVARYSVKMMTRLSDHLPLGRMLSLSQLTRLGRFAVATGLGRSRPIPHLFQQGRFFGGWLTEQAGRRFHRIVGGLFQARSSSAYSSSTLSICRWRMPMVGLTVAVRRLAVRSECSCCSKVVGKGSRAGEEPLLQRQQARTRWPSSPCCPATFSCRSLVYFFSAAWMAFSSAV